MLSFKMPEYVLPTMYQSLSKISPGFRVTAAEVRVSPTMAELSILQSMLRVN